MKRTEYAMPSSTGTDTLHLVEWLPAGKVKGILQISHGMIECIERYERFARFMVKQGFAVIGNDHLGHGKTAAASKKYGYFAPHNGSAYVVSDLHRVSQFIRKKYPDVPLVLLGHSMGSFMARRYAMTFGDELDALILMGTGSKPQWLLTIGLQLVKLFRMIMGDRTHNWFLEKLCFAWYNRHFEPIRTSFDWLSRNAEEVERYRRNPYCQFTFTLNGYQTLFEVISYIQKKKHVRKLPKSLPILFVSGTEDPVGAYGRGVREVAMQYRRAGVKQVSCYLYCGARHELVHEYGYQRVQKDICRWILASANQSDKNSSI